MLCIKNIGKYELDCEIHLMYFTINEWSNRSWIAIHTCERFNRVANNTIIIRLQDV